MEIPLLKDPIAIVTYLTVFTLTMNAFEKAFPRNPAQRVFRKLWGTDVLHLVFSISLSTVIALVLLMLSKSLASRVPHIAEFQARVASQPLGLQFVEMLLLIEFVNYWSHRWTHTVPFLWKFHRIHHSVRELDWMAGPRLHPVDFGLRRAMVFTPPIFFGFTKEILAGFFIYGVIKVLSGDKVKHGNIRINFGWLNYVLALNQHHHWHHALHPANKNMAATLPVFDWMFGTLYLPRGGKLPARYGCEEYVPEDYLGQIIQPLLPYEKGLEMASWRPWHRALGDALAARLPGVSRALTAVAAPLERARHACADTLEALVEAIGMLIRNVVTFLVPRPLLEAIFLSDVEPRGFAGERGATRAAVERAGAPRPLDGIP